MPVTAHNQWRNSLLQGIAQVLQSLQHIVFVIGLFDKAAAIQTQSVPCVFGVSRNEYDIELRLYLFKVIGSFNTAEPRHFNVKEKHIGIMLSHKVNGFGGIFRKIMRAHRINGVHHHFHHAS